MDQWGVSWWDGPMGYELVGTWKVLVVVRVTLGPGHPALGVVAEGGTHTHTHTHTHSIEY